MLLYLLLYVITSGLAVAIMSYEEKDQISVWLLLLLSVGFSWLIVPFKVVEFVSDMFSSSK